MQIIVFLLEASAIIVIYQVYHHCLSVDVMGTAGTDNVVKNLHCMAHNHNDRTVRRHTHNDAHYHFPEMIH